MAALLCLLPLGALAQTPAAAPSQALLKPAELDQLVAPIALYPDPLLSEVLIASTYPLEVVQADRWAKSNNSLKGEALTAALAKQGWDDSVKALAQVPNVLTMMADQLDWTQKLGDAVLAQQPELMDAIQRLRGRAQANGKLQSTKEQTVTVKSAAPAQGGGGQAQEGQAPAHTSSSSRRRPPRCMCRTTIQRSFTVPGLILIIRRTIFRLHLGIMHGVRLPPGSHSAAPSQSVMPSGATATGAAATSTSPIATLTSTI